MLTSCSGLYIPTFITNLHLFSFLNTLHSVVYRWKDQWTDRLLSQFKVQNLYRWHRQDLTGLWLQWKTTSQEDNDNFMRQWPHSKTQSRSIYYFFKIRPSFNLQEHLARPCSNQPESEALYLVHFKNIKNEQFKSVLN